MNVRDEACIHYGKVNINFILLLVLDDKVTILEPLSADWTSVQLHNTTSADLVRVLIFTFFDFFCIFLKTYTTFKWFDCDCGFGLDFGFRYLVRTLFYKAFQTLEINGLGLVNRPVCCVKKHVVTPYTISFFSQYNRNIPTTCTPPRVIADYPRCVDF